MAARQAANEEERRRFIDKKVRTGFHLFDVNKDGLLTADDYIAIADYISEKTGANTEQAENTRREWVKWMKYLQPDPSVIVDVERHLETCAELRQDMENYRGMNREWASDLYDRLDFDGDGKVSLEELKIFYGALGYTDEGKIKEIFKEINKDGSDIIDREEFIDDLVRYWTCDDPVSGRSRFMIDFE